MNRMAVVVAHALVALAVTVLPARAQAQTQVAPEDHEAHHPAVAPEQSIPVTPPPAAPGTQQSGMQGMQVMAQMAERQKALDALVAKMNASTGDAKIAAMAELLTALVQQHAAMHKSMMGMHGGMMKN